MQRDLEHFKVENGNLKKQIEALQIQIASMGRQESAGNSSPQYGAIARPSGGSSRSNSLSAANQSGQGRLDQPRGRFSETHMTPLPPPVSQKTYAIQPRDTLASIARKQQVRLDALLAANPGVEPKRLKVGQVLNIP
jgi:LysM repeat protein